MLEMPKKSSRFFNCLSINFHKVVCLMCFANFTLQ